MAQTPTTQITGDQCYSHHLINEHRTNVSRSKILPGFPLSHKHVSHKGFAVQKSSRHPRLQQHMAQIPKINASATHQRMQATCNIKTSFHCGRAYHDVSRNVRQNPAIEHGGPWPLARAGHHWHRFSIEAFGYRKRMS